MSRGVNTPTSLSNLTSHIRQVEEERKYLGGDEDHTILVKGNALRLPTP